MLYLALVLVTGITIGAIDTSGGKGGGGGISLTTATPIYF